MITWGLTSMRWLVEVSSLGKTDVQKVCIEAESWQRALQAARAQRGELGPMSGFSIELLEEGYRAVDPLARIRFVVKRAPDDMPVTYSAAATLATRGASAPPAKSAAAPPAQAAPSPTDAKGPRPSSQPAPRPSSQPAPRPVSQPPPARSSPATRSSAPPPMTPTTGPVADRADAPAVGTQIPGFPPVKVVSRREQDPSDASPLTYREYGFALPPGTAEDIAADLLRAQLRIVQMRIADAKMGKLVNLAAFDVEFEGKPPKAPIATLTWKDWKGEPVIGFPRATGASASSLPRPPSKEPPSLAPGAPMHVPPPAPLPVIETSPGLGAARNDAPAPKAAPASAHAANGPAARAPAPAPVAAPAPAPAPVAAAPAAAFPAPKAAASQAAAAAAAPAPAKATIPEAPPEPRVTEGEAKRSPSRPSSSELVRTPSGRFVRGRVTGDELITSLFESMHDLHFLRDALDGGQFCLALATEVLPARAALVHFFDLEKREWVVACARGKEAARLLNTRSAESDAVLVEAARKRRAVVMSSPTQADAKRYQELGGGRSLIVAPIMQAGRALGALEIINPLDGMPFTEDEGNAITYIAEQYAEYLGSRGIVLDRERISAAATA